MTCHLRSRKMCKIEAFHYYNIAAKAQLCYILALQELARLHTSYDIDHLNYFEQSYLIE